MTSRAAAAHPRPPRIHIGGVKISRRAVAHLATVALVLGGVSFAYAVPAMMAVDVRFANPGDITTGLLVGLMLAFLGTGTVRSFSHLGRRTPVSAGSVPIPGPHGAPIIKEILGYGLPSSNRGPTDDIAVTFAYYRHHPCSVFLHICTIDEDGRSTSSQVRWEMSRDDLHATVAAGTPSGIGDIRASLVNASVAQLRLMDTEYCERSLGEYYDLRLPRHELLAFLVGTLDLVPLGSEFEHLNINDAVERLLSR